MKGLSGYIRLLGASALALAAGASAQNVIRITNVEPVREIPLEANSNVQFDSNGNLLARCALTNGVCAALSSGGTTNPGAPSATLTRADNNNDVRVNQSITLAWNSTGATVCNARSDGPTSTTWGGPRAINNNGGESITVSAVGTYTFGLTCFNAGGGSSERIVTVQVSAASSGGQPGAGACNITDPLIQPSSMQRQDKTWVTAWSAPNNSNIAIYPNSIGSLVPLGAEKRKYTVIPFTPTADTLGASTVRITWDVAQPNHLIGYTTARPTLGGMFITISPCPGDLRPANDQSTDPFLRSACRKFDTEGSMFYAISGSNSLVCKLDPGVQYYLNVAAVNTADGLQEGEDTCVNNLTGCDVQASHRLQ